MREGIFVGAFCFVLSVVTTSCNSPLCETGVHTTGTVLDKKNNVITIGFFRQPKRENPDTLWESYDDEGNRQVLVGEWITLDLKVTSQEFDFYKVDDLVWLSYEKGNPKNVVLCDELDIMNSSPDNDTNLQ